MGTTVGMDGQSEHDYDYHFLKDFKSISISKDVSLLKNGSEYYNFAYDTVPLCLSFSNDAFNWQLND